MEPAAPGALAAAGQAEPQSQGPGWWPHGWWKLMEIRVGVLPLPVILLLGALLAAFIGLGKLPLGRGTKTPDDVCTAIAILAVGGFACGELGRRMPGLRHIGAAAICATFIPSCLAYYHLLPATVERGVTDFTNQTNFLYLFIAAIIVGSILGMDRTVLIKGFLKIFVPLFAGSVAAMIVGTAVGVALGLGVRHALFYVVIPIMAGGVGEGAIPLSVGYAAILHTRSGDEFASVLPPVMFGSLTAIVLSGALNFAGKRFPHLTGEGRLQPGEHDDLDPQSEAVPAQVDVGSMAAAGAVAIALYLTGVLCFTLSDRLPAPVVMLFLAVVVKLTMAVPPRIQQGAHVMYRFFAVAVTYPLLFAIGTAMTPWDKLIAALHPANLVTIVATVTTLMATGYAVARAVNLYPIDTAIVNACHSGQGGTGDVAILTAANRMQLMPFAQIATRIGGAITVTLTLFALAHRT
ncbi:MAG TPA: 2-hydroxycarboxylate transporter family protein [Opitutaceae bacterium]|nr:2-hydroxycarboxylate transporter family protein [Opitutaceae bacterium]